MKKQFYKKNVVFFIISLTTIISLSSNKTVFGEWGDIVLNNKSRSMELANVKAVLFPHWFHRIRFKCKVCHEKIFIMKKGANDINMSDLINKKYCGKCHDGEIAFSTKNCERCHSYNKEELPKKRLTPLRGIQLKKQYTAYRKEYASKVDGTDKDGIRFKTTIMLPGLSSDKKAFKDLKKDRYGLVDWVKAVTEKKIAPITNIKSEYVEDRIISRKKIIKTKSKVVNDVIFPHDIHTYWLSCENCHDQVFPLNKPINMFMKDFLEGKWCGKCHGKVSFPLIDCNRCHRIAKDASESITEG